MKLENIGGYLLIIGAAVFLGSYVVPAITPQWKKYGEYAVIGGAAIWIVGKVT